MPWLRNAVSVNGQASDFTRCEQVFCSMQGIDVFHSVSHKHDIWKQDPYDVEAIHADARCEFEKLIDRATSSLDLQHGKILLILGDSGSGKTHLMRSFRNYVHTRQLGYCGYMQMTIQTDNYGHYILSNLIDSLDQPYNEPELASSALMYLSTTLVENKSILTVEQLSQLRDKELSDQQLGEYVCQLVDQLMREDRYCSLDLDLVRALVFLQRNDPRIKGRILKYLRCELLPDFDWKVLGSVLTRESILNPQRMVENLGRAMQAVHSQQASLVLLIDQLEDIHNLDDANKNFRRAMDTIRQIADNVPAAVIVVAGLDEFYIEMKKHLGASVIDRLEHEPKPVKLKDQRSFEDIKQIVARRLVNLYDVAEIAIEDENLIFPFTEPQLKALVNLTTRKIVNWCREYRDQCISEGKLIESMVQSSSDVSPCYKDIANFEQTWSLYQSEHPYEMLDDEDQLITLLGWALEQCANEIDSACTIKVSPNGWLMDIEIIAPDNKSHQLMLGFCNKRAQGGGLAKQLNELSLHAGENTPVIVRTTEFPRTSTSKISKLIGSLIKEKKARKVLAEDADWRAMAAFRDFMQQHQENDIFNQWRCVEKPLTQLKTPQKVLCFDEWSKITVKPEDQPNNATVKSSAVPVLPSVVNLVENKPADVDHLSKQGKISVGIETGLNRKAVTLDRGSLKKHVAFLGSSGSGKTTIALHIIEQLLLSELPVILIDRKGDLCRYASQEWWGQQLSDPMQQGRKDKLRRQIKVDLYTPGNPDGCPLGITVVPDNLNQMSEFDCNRVAMHAANALGVMMGYKPTTNSDKTRIAILSKAILLLGKSDQLNSSLTQLIEIIAEQDTSLVSEVGHLDQKNFKKLAEDLQTLYITRKFLLSSDVEPLSVDRLLGRGNHTIPGKTRLSIISTKYLNDNSEIEFWVSRLLVDIGRWIDHNPSEALQAILMLDEADLYLPAQRKPATKEPMEHLIKRARSAGLGLFLATQNPGDFDYKFRENIFTWLVGKISEKNSVEKVKPLFESSTVNVATGLLKQQTGEFYLMQEGNAKALKCEQSLMETKQLSHDEILILAKKTNV